MSANLIADRTAAFDEKSVAATQSRIETNVTTQNQTVLLPQSLGSLFDAAFDLYKRHFSTLGMIVALIFIPVQIVLHIVATIWLRPLIAQIAANPSNTDYGQNILAITIGFFTGSPGNGIPGFLTLYASFLVSGPASLAAAHLYLGIPISVRAAYSGAFKSMYRLFWAWLLFLFVFVGVGLSAAFVILFAAAMIIGALSAAGIPARFFSGPEISVILIIVSILIPYLLSCMVSAQFFSFVPSLIAVERLSISNAMTRNSQLVGRAFIWRVFAAVLALPVVIFGLQAMILFSASSVVEALKWPSWAGFIMSTGLAGIISFFLQPYWMIFLMMLYFDCRFRREGLDIRIMADRVPKPVAQTEETQS